MTNHRQLLTQSEMRSTEGQPPFSSFRDKYVPSTDFLRRSSTPAQLVRQCVSNMDALLSGTVWDGDSGRDEVANLLFFMHEWFISSGDLAQIFISLYRSCQDFLSCDSFCCTHSSSSAGCLVHRYRSCVCLALRYWVVNFPMHFSMDQKLAEVVSDFCTVLMSEGDRNLSDLINLSMVPPCDWMNKLSIRNTAGKHTRKVSLVFNHLEPAELAAQLTYLEFKALHRIQFADFKRYATSGSLKEQPELSKSVALFNGLSQWVQCMVLCKTTPQQRADVMTKFVSVAQKLRGLQNFSSLMAVVGGLTHSAISRLSKTLDCVSGQSLKTLRHLSDLLSSDNNFSNYRKAFRSCVGFKIPVLGVHLRDLISLHAALLDWVGDGQLNVRKMMQLSPIMRDLTGIQQHRKMPVDANIDVVNTLRFSLDPHYTEDEIFELSLAREPRSSLSSAELSPRPVVFAEWLTGVSRPDVKTVTKHVRDMVEAVFRHYDTDKDEFISHEEFQSIAGNFPFMDSFCVLDSDRDGLISKSEMEAYFVRANCLALRTSFRHDFHETTYFKPTYCVHCSGLLWGIIKQGWKCKDCGINSHKHCKDLVVMECGVRGASVGEDGSHRVTEKQRDSNLSNDVTSPEMEKPANTETLHQEEIMDCLSGLDKSTQTYLARANAVLRGRASSIASGEFYEDQLSVYERLVKVEEEKEELVEENKRLSERLELLAEQNIALKSHIRVIRHNTVSFILQQMDTLHMQRDTEV